MAVQTRSVADICLEAKRASRMLAQLDRGKKDAALIAIAGALVARTDEILEANARDMEAGREGGLTAALLDRLSLDAGRAGGVGGGGGGDGRRGAAGGGPRRPGRRGRRRAAVGQRARHPQGPRSARRRRRRLRGA